jgi:hypothetical protein
MSGMEVRFFLGAPIDKQTQRQYNKTMYKIIGKEETFKVLTLGEAMNVAKSMNEFVTIKGPDFEIVGVFGVDSIKDGLCPDGVKYDWNKASRIGATKRR